MIIIKAIALLFYSRRAIEVHLFTFSDQKSVPSFMK